MFGKLMSVSDDLMWRYIELLSFQPLTQVAKWKTETEEGRNPRDIKVMFAQEIVDPLSQQGGSGSCPGGFRGALQARRDAG